MVLLCSGQCHLRLWIMKKIYQWRNRPHTQSQNSNLYQLENNAVDSVFGSKSDRMAGHNGPFAFNCGVVNAKWGSGYSSGSAWLRLARRLTRSASKCRPKLIRSNSAVWRDSSRTHLMVVWKVNRPLFAGDPEVRILGYGKEQMWKQIFTRSALTCCADDVRTPG